MHAPWGGSTAQHAALHTSQYSTTYQSQPGYAYFRRQLITDFDYWIVAQTANPVTMELDLAI